ncbi:WD40 repeat-like protein [Leucogyrophana mollusca]|uniref:WD40 repeat-like protein n=1 Tax=Leucogyrophana mollusca TaxID=85980 RepID=A0ACB8AX96_9AGAM|nr:WD40 repeat-like protein [Leucogyrophana mollusca]
MSTSTSSIESSAARRVSRPPTKVFKGHTDVVRSVAYFPDGQHITSGSDDKTVIIWDVESGRQDGQPLRHDSDVEWIAISPDGRRIAIGVKGGLVVRLWDADTGRPSREPLECDGVVLCVAFSPDGLRIAAGVEDSFQVFDVSTGESVVGPIKGHTGVVSSVVYSLDGRLLVTVSQDKRIWVWDSKTGVQVRKPMPGHENDVWCISITADGRRIASAGGFDKTVQVWDLETRLQIGDSFHADNFVFSVAFSPDDRYIVSDYGNDVALWDTESFAIQGPVSIFILLQYSF